MPDSPVREEAAIERARRWHECFEEGVTLGGEPCLRDELVWDAPPLVADLLALTASDRSEIDRLRQAISDIDTCEEPGCEGCREVAQDALRFAAEPVSTGLAAEPEPQIEQCDPSCPSALAAGRPDRCGLFSFPPTCTSDRCSLSGASPQAAPEATREADAVPCPDCRGHGQFMDDHDGTQGFYVGCNRCDGTGAL